MEMATIFLSSTRDLHDTPHFVCAALMAEEPRQEFVESQAIRLRPALAARHFDTGCVHDERRDPMAMETAMQPESIASCFVAAHHGRVRREAKALLGPANFLEELRHGSRGYRPFAWVLRHADGATELPRRCPQCKGQKQCDR